MTALPAFKSNRLPPQGNHEAFPTVLTNLNRLRVLALLLISCIIRNPLVWSQEQNTEGNITRLSAGTSTGAADGDALHRDMLPLVMTASTGSGLDVGQQPYQVGVISVRPSYIQILSKQLSPLYLRPSDMIGATFNPTKAFRYGPAALSQPLTVDPDDMEISTLTLFTFRGFNFNKPSIEIGLDYDTNSNNTLGQNSASSIAQLSTIRIPFTYGTVPGDSAFLMRLDYKPTYRLLLSGPGGNEINHDLIFQAGKDLGRFAFSLNNQGTLSSIPIRELAGRNRVFANRTNLRSAYDMTGKSFIVSELGHSFSTRTVEGAGNISNLSKSPTIVVDDFEILYNYQLQPKILLIPEFEISRTQIANSIVWTKAVALRSGYFPTRKLAFTPLAGIQFRDAKGSSTEISTYYGIEMDYLVRPRTVLELDLRSEVRPSFVDEGIFLRENSIEFGIQEALLLRWLLELRFNYTLRTQDSSIATSVIDQTDIGMEFTVGYMLTRLSYIDLSVNRYQLKDNITGFLSTRLNVQFSYNRAF